MNDRRLQINLTSILAPTFGCIGVALVVLEFFVRAGDAIGDLGLIFVTGAALMRVRSWFCRMSATERNAYEIGRDSVRSLR